MCWEYYNDKMNVLFAGCSSVNEQPDVQETLQNGQEKMEEE